MFCQSVLLVQREADFYNWITIGAMNGMWDNHLSWSTTLSMNEVLAYDMLESMLYDYTSSDNKSIVMNKAKFGQYFVQRIRTPETMYRTQLWYRGAGQFG